MKRQPDNCAMASPLRIDVAVITSMPPAAVIAVLRQEFAQADGGGLMRLPFIRHRTLSGRLDGGDFRLRHSGQFMQNPGERELIGTLVAEGTGCRIEGCWRTPWQQRAALIFISVGSIVSLIASPGEWVGLLMSLVIGGIFFWPLLRWTGRSGEEKLETRLRVITTSAQ